MNAEFLSGVWRDPVLHIHLLQQMETYPPFGTMREVNIENIVAQLNRTLLASGKSKLTREQVESRIDRLVATKHSAFSNVDLSEFTHPDFVRLRSDAVSEAAAASSSSVAVAAAAAPGGGGGGSAITYGKEYDLKRASFASPLPVKSKRARTSAAASTTSTAATGGGDDNDATNTTTTTTTTTAASSSSSVAVESVVDDGRNPADVALAKDSNLVQRMRRFERSWRRFAHDSQKVPEFSKLVYSAIASVEARSATFGEVLAYVQQNLKKALVPGELARFAGKSESELRDATQKALLNNAVFFELPFAASGDPMKKPWTVGSIASLKMDEEDATAANTATKEPPNQD
jgi:hypothetical protein